MSDGDRERIISFIFTRMPAKHFVGYNSHKLIPFTVNTDNFHTKRHSPSKYVDAIPQSETKPELE